MREVGAITRALVLQEAADERKKARNRKLRDKKKKKKMARKEAAEVMATPATSFWDGQREAAGGVVVHHVGIRGIFVGRWSSSSEHVT